ncbi:MAG: hypothetical protein COU11_04655 [Candidatus Harrisonbacteria bacterium CG10_big_fil_rev_8_21_14_0_10_49_15]|uniref:HD domain-containing protein n=1 Tax=Candidatus Harrisonbacteria bacterium CG10_big_fil_rev_8_21_14_0_10_49_15 TaxID=1974587 RepID=A0A2H0ULV9_9BACT|nr:MAG: hypothetical protein COU11_04655 [Candidatus Harrisonbacteria bacterium CG10_big_fil_rev_8_21_14_0_10_49_15]
MPTTQELAERLRTLVPGRPISKAIELVLERHGDRTRLGGEPEVNHVLRVGIAGAEYALANLPEQLETLALCGVLHDVLEDTPTTDTELVNFFGGEVARVVRALSHVEEEEPEAIYYARVAAGGQLAVVIKRCDRLDNFGCLHAAPEKFQRKVLRLQRAALPIWRSMDPEGYPLIVAALDDLDRRLNHNPCDKQGKGV